jgi:hypothetical protein
MITRITITALLLLGCNGDKDGDSGDTGATTPSDELTVLGDTTNLPAAALLSIWASSDQDVFMVGADDGAGPLVLHWDGSAWSRIATGSTGDLWWVWSDGGDIVWMSGDGGRVLQYSRFAGAVVSEEVVTDPAYKLFGIWGTGPGDVWVVGGDINNNNDGIVVHWDGTAWTEAHLASPNPSDGTSRRQAFKVWGSGASDVWVVGTGSYVSHWDGAAWSDQPQPTPPTAPLTTVSGAGPNEAYAVGGYGNAIVAHYDGTAWADISPPPYDAVPAQNGVYAGSPEGIVTCGWSGSIYWIEGTALVADPRPRATTKDFHACWIDDQGAVWAVGGDLTNLDEGVIVYGGDRVPPVSL